MLKNFVAKKISVLIKDQTPSTRLGVEKVVTYDRAMVQMTPMEICPANLTGQFRAQNANFVE